MSVNEIELQDLQQDDTELDSASVALSPSLLDRIPVELELKIGVLDLTLGTINGLKHGQVVSTQLGLDEPVELLYQQQVIARGELVVVDDCYAIRVTETCKEGL